MTFPESELVVQPMQEANDQKPAEESTVQPIQPRPKRVVLERREEVILRKRKDQREKKLEWLAKKRKKRERITANQAKIKLKSFNFRTPHRDIMKYLKREKQMRCANRRLRITNVVGHRRYKYPKVMANLLIIVRIKRDKDVPAEFKELMRRLGLNRLCQAVLVKKTKELLETLLKLGPFVTFGSPSGEAVRDLVHRRGKHVTYEDGERKRVPLSDNRIIEDALGEYDIICVEDLVEEILTIGPAFDKCLKFLSAFRVTPDKSKRRFNYSRQFKDGGDWGFRPGNKIMDLFI